MSLIYILFALVYSDIILTTSMEYNIWYTLQPIHIAMHEGLTMHINHSIGNDLRLYACTAHACMGAHASVHAWVHMQVCMYVCTVHAFVMCILVYNNIMMLVNCSMAKCNQFNQYW